MTRMLILAAVLPLIAAAPVRPPPAVGPEPRGTAVVLAPRPGSAIDATARRLVADDIAAGRAEKAPPLVLTGSAPLGTASDRPALFVQLQSARECGSGGCSTTVYLWMKGRWERVLDGVGGRITIGAGRSRGMADLMTEKGRYVWSGTAYRDPQGAPVVQLRRRR